MRIHVLLIVICRYFNAKSSFAIPCLYTMPTYHFYRLKFLVLESRYTWSSTNYNWNILRLSWQVFFISSCAFSACSLGLLVSRMGWCTLLGNVSKRRYQDLETLASITDVPSTKRVLKSTLALLNMPSFKDTTINWDPLNRVRSSWPIFCVCDKSNAASTSSRMYMGAGLNWSSDKIKDRAIRDLHHPN